MVDGDGAFGIFCRILAGAICVRIYFAFMVMVGVCSTCPILVKNNPKFGVPKLIRLKVICN